MAKLTYTSVGILQNGPFKGWLKEVSPDSDRYTKFPIRVVHYPKSEPPWPNNYAVQLCSSVDTWYDIEVFFIPLEESTEMDALTILKFRVEEHLAIYINKICEVLYTT